MSEERRIARLEAQREAVVERRLREPAAFFEVARALRVARDELAAFVGNRLDAALRAAVVDLRRVDSAPRLDRALAIAALIRLLALLERCRAGQRGAGGEKHARGAH